MLLRTILFGAIALIGGLCLFIQLSPGIMLGLVKNDIVNAYEDAGLDVSECKKHKVSIFDPSGGMQDCMQSVYRDVQRKMEAADDVGGPERK